ncbi:hypothetical protein Y032_0688g1541, partial [Ancylostoma ceylanicum]
MNSQNSKSLALLYSRHASLPMHSLDVKVCSLLNGKRVFITEPEDDTICRLDTRRLKLRTPSPSKMRVKKCPTKIVVAEVEGSPLAEASASSRLSFAGRVASAAIKKYEQDDDDMPVLHPEVAMNGETPERKIIANASSILSSWDRLRLKRRRDVHMEETEFLKCIVNGFPGRQLRHRHNILEGRKSEVMQPAAKRRKKGFVRPVKPNGALNATKKIDLRTRPIKRKEDEKLQQSVMNILKEAQEKMKRKIADGILKQRVEFAKLWQSRLRSATAVQSDAKAKQPVPPIRANNAGKRSSPKSPKILQSSTQRKGQ